MSKISILALGSRGDVQPFVALAQGLMAAGHEVVVCVPDLFADFVTEHGVGYAPMPSDFLKLTDSSLAADAIESGGASGYKLIGAVRKTIPAMLQAEWEGSQGADLVIYHPKAMGGYHIAEKLAIPQMMSMPLPNTPTKQFPSPILPPSTPRFLNKLSFRAGQLALAPFMGVINEFRQETLGLGKRGRFANEAVDSLGRDIATLYSYSPLIVPDPADWPASVRATGYWFLDRPVDWQPSEALSAFLQAGPAPVYVGFGSMPSKDPQAKGRLVVEALRQAGQRGVLASGWGGLQADDLPGEMFLLEHAPHDWLFPQMAAVVHHGGAGTTAAGLRAGRPSLIAPFFGDQPFWGNRVYELGAGPKPIPQKKLTAETLAAAIREMVDNTAMQQRAVQLGDQLRTEDGVASAVAAIETYLK